MADTNGFTGNPARWNEQYDALNAEITAILFYHDPIRISCGTNTDEYKPEARTILPRLADCDSVDEVRGVIHEEFSKWFTARIAGPESRYQGAAEDVWEAWQRFANSSGSKNNDV